MEKTNNPVREVGYCRHCLTNVQHQRSLRTAWGRILDRATCGIGRYLGLGTWLCMSCGAPSWLFPPYRKDAGEYDPRRSSTRNQTAPEIERVGNYLESERSLVTRSQRRRQHSPRFRARVVEMILRGEASFSNLRKRLDVSELDLQDWIAQYHRDRLSTSTPSGMGEGEVLEGAVIRPVALDAAPVPEPERRSDG